MEGNKTKKINRFFFQICSEILDSLQSGDFGSPGKSCADDYRKTCSALFRHAAKFRNPAAAVNCNNNNHAGNGKDDVDKEEAVEP
jgi:hypothetical protein